MRPVRRWSTRLEIAPHTNPCCAEPTRMSSDRFEVGPVPNFLYEKAKPLPGQPLMWQRTRKALLLGIETRKCGLKCLQEL